MHERIPEAMRSELNKNQNPQPFKEVIQIVTHEIQERVYWFCSMDQLAFLEKCLEKQANGRQMFKKRIAQITQQKLTQLFSQIQQNHKVSTDTHGLNIQIIQQNGKKVLIPDVPTFDVDYFSPHHKKTKQIEIKLKKINEDFKNFKHRTDKIKQDQLERRLQKEMIEEETKRNIEKDRRKRYHSEVRRKIQQYKVKEKERKEQNEKFHQFFKIYKQSKPMHVLMEQSFNRKAEKYRKQEYQTKMSQIRVLQKPSLEEINDHDRAYMELKEEWEGPPISHQTVDVSYRSKFYLDERKKMREGEDENPIWDHVEKKKRYSEFVHDNYKPRISERKRNLRQRNERKTISIIREAPSRKERFEKGNIYLQHLHSLKKKENDSEADEGRASQRFHYKNYLEELKKSRAEKRKSYDWQKQFNELSGTNYEKAEKVLLRSRQLEEKAHRQEEYISTHKHNKPTDILERKKEIDESLMEAMKAKMAILKETDSK